MFLENIFIIKTRQGMCKPFKINNGQRNTMLIKTKTKCFDFFSCVLLPE